MTLTKAPFSTISFLGLQIHQATMQQTLAWMESCIQDRKPRFLCTLNAALLVWAQNDPFLAQIYCDADLATCDSVVVYYALKCLGTPVPEPLEACQIMFEFIKRNYQKGYRFYFLGAKPAIVEQAITALRKNYPSIQIAGYHHGYFHPEKTKEIAQAIAKTKPDCLFIGISSPLKEQFLKTHIQEMAVPISLGVGGGIDILAGQYRLSPSCVRKMGFAWLYRLLSEPRRMWKRYLTTNSIFLWLFLKTWTKKVFS